MKLEGNLRAIWEELEKRGGEQDQTALKGCMRFSKKQKPHICAYFSQLIKATIKDSSTFL